MAEPEVNAIAAMESEAGIAKWRIAMVALGIAGTIIGLLLSVLLTQLLAASRQTAAAAEAANRMAQEVHDYNYSQDQKIALNAQAVTRQQTEIDTTVATQAALTLQVARISEKLDDVIAPHHYKPLTP